MAGIPVTTVVVNYAYTIFAKDKDGLETEVGTLQTFNASATRQVTRQRGVQPNLSDMNDSTHLVPGYSDYTLQVDRLELYNRQIFQAFGLTSIETFDQIKDVPLTIVESRKSPYADLLRELLVSPASAGTALATSLLNSVSAPGGNLFPPMEVRVRYVDCIPETWSKTIQVGQASVTESITFACKKIEKDTGSSELGIVTKIGKGILGKLGFGG